MRRAVSHAISRSVFVVKCHRGGLLGLERISHLLLMARPVYFFRCKACTLRPHKASASFLPEAQRFVHTISAVWTCRVPASRTWGILSFPAQSLLRPQTSALSCGCCISASETEAHYLESNPMMPKLLGDSLRIIRKGSVQRCSEHARGGKTSHVTGPRSILNAFYQCFFPAKESESSSWCNTHWHLGRQRLNGQPFWRGTQQKTAPNLPLPPNCQSPYPTLTSPRLSSSAVGRRFRHASGLLLFVVIRHSLPPVFFLCGL
jgi:hypothetical protein